MDRIAPLPVLESLLAAEPAQAEPAIAGLATAVVAAVDEDAAHADLQLGGASLRAAVAVSCLVRPIPGDKVLAFRGDGEAFVLGVLEREAPNYATLALPGHGNLAIEGETLSLTARQRLALKADGLDLQARTLAFIADKATWLGKALTAIVERWHVSAKAHEVSAETMTAKAENRIAIVDQVDTLRAQTQSIKIAGIVSETAQSKVIAVSDDLRMDGKRITMG
ncbi:DUF3540 domain-containing protein [Bosea sp. BK604]|uniref:DUF3540 domain-containing protein n=1 Tax=Bosea sp. BK604 TaxID=2512180 RepID=UPI001045E2AD|nr:DUF3540 domain-containing protein [Bosea sp. BK604]TCR64182.1 uncharacterized protein DUF3540 [Bosea sp. BK604]